ncbi:MAG: hypothetical protein QM752_02550 [Gammaproteobacteria bacterium]
MRENQSTTSETQKIESVRPPEESQQLAEIQAASVLSDFFPTVISKMICEYLDNDYYFVIDLGLYSPRVKIDELPKPVTYDSTGFITYQDLGNCLLHAFRSLFDVTHHPDGQVKVNIKSSALERGLRPMKSENERFEHVFEDLKSAIQSSKNPRFDKENNKISQYDLIVESNENKVIQGIYIQRFNSESGTFSKRHYLDFLSYYFPRDRLQYTEDLKNSFFKHIIYKMFSSDFLRVNSKGWIDPAARIKILERSPQNLARNKFLELYQNGDPPLKASSTLDEIVALALRAQNAKWYSFHPEGLKAKQAILKMLNQNETWFREQDNASLRDELLLYGQQLYLSTKQFSQKVLEAKGPA